MVEHIIDDLNKEVWYFWYDSRVNYLYLDSYIFCSRKSKRHKWEVIKSYRRLDSREPFTITALKADQVPLTEEIKKEALDNFVKEIKVDFWTKN